MSLYKRKAGNKDVWYMSLTINGRRKRITTGETSRKRAEQVHAKVLNDIRDGKWFQKCRAEATTFRELADKYVSKYQRQRDSTSLKQLLPFFGEMTLAGITAETVEDYIISRDESVKNPKPATIYQEFSLGRRMYNVARRRWRWVSNNPFADIEFYELLEVNNRRTRWLTAEEEERLLSFATPGYLKDVILFALDTGCRRGEILSCNWKHNVDMQRRLITIQASKNGNLKAIPMTETLYNMMLRRSRVVDISGLVFPVSVLAMKDSFERAVLKAKLEDFRFHDLRHTFATRLVQNGVDLYSVKELMGHKSIRTTERYAHHYPESIRASVMVLDKCHKSVSLKGRRDESLVALPNEIAVKSACNAIGSV